jgi:hypothetical protein
MIVTVLVASFVPAGGGNGVDFRVSDDPFVTFQAGGASGWA